MIRLSCSYADYQGALEDCDAVLKANEAAAGDALLLAFLRVRSAMMGSAVVTKLLTITPSFWMLPHWPMLRPL